MSSKSWYSAQCVFLHSDKGSGPKQMLEERIVLLRAESVEAAIERAEKEAEEYCRDLDGCKYVGYVNVFAIYDDKLTDGAEIFSSMQKSDLKPKEYLELYYPDGPDDCEAVGKTCVFRGIVGTDSGSSWAPIPEPSWAAIPVHRGHLFRCHMSS